MGRQPLRWSCRDDAQAGSLKPPPKPQAHDLRICDEPRLLEASVVRGSLDAGWRRRHLAEVKWRPPDWDGRNEKEYLIKLNNYVFMVVVLPRRVVTIIHNLPDAHFSGNSIQSTHDLAVVRFVQLFLYLANLSV